MRRPLDWDASAYAQVSGPQRSWGLALLALRPWRGDEAVLDAGCGPGALAEEILRRLPRGRVVALDADPGMVETARQRLEAYGSRARVLQADLARLPPLDPVDVVFSNAVFHWVPDHEALFRGLFRVLKPGGQLLAQCGGAGNIDRVVRVAAALSKSDEFAAHFRAWSPPMHFEDDATTAWRLAAAGFEGIDAGLSDAPVRFDDAAAFARFARTAPLLPYLSHLPALELRDRFLARFLHDYEAAGHAWELDYVRLTMRAWRPVA